MIVFVPGLSAKEQGASMARLTEGMEQYAKSKNIHLLAEGGTAPIGWKAYALATDRTQSPAVPSTGDARAIGVDVQEVFWGDLLDQLSEMPSVKRAWNGTKVLGYWFCAPFRFYRTVFWDNRNTWLWFTIVAPAFLLVAWYYGAVAAALTLIGSAEGADFLPAVIGLEDRQWLGQIGEAMGSWTIWATASVILAFVPANRIVDAAYSMKRFLQNEDDLAQKTRSRINDALMEIVHKGAHQKVTVVAYSFGAVPAVQALANFETTTPIRLVTLGAPLGSMASRSHSIQKALDDLLVNQTVERWDYLHSEEDWIGSRPPIEHDGSRIFTLPLRFSTNLVDKLTRKNHAQYFEEDEVYAVLFGTR
jgi:hypothetical protein